MEKSEFNFSLDVSNRIIVYRHKGLLQIDEIGRAWKNLIDIKEFHSSDFNLLSDYSEAEFAFDSGSTEIAWEFLYSIRHILENKKEAVITSTPLSTAYSMMFEKESAKRLNFMVKTFSTEEAAIRWLISK